MCSLEPASAKKTYFVWFNLLLKCDSWKGPATIVRVRLNDTDTRKQHSKEFMWHDSFLWLISHHSEALALSLSVSFFFFISKEFLWSLYGRKSLLFCLYHAGTALHLINNNAWVKFIYLQLLIQEWYEMNYVEILHVWQMQSFSTSLCVRNQVKAIFLQTFTKSGPYIV